MSASLPRSVRVPFLQAGLMLVSLLLVVASGAWSTTAFAASTVDTFNFDSEEQEQRYRGLIAEIRCPKCQNVNIAGSDAPIAKDLRVTVHRLLSDGMSDVEVLDFLQARYGDFVLYNPPLRGNTLLLWLLPLIGFVAAVVVVVRLARREPASDALSDADAEQLDRLLSSSDSVSGAGSAAGDVVPTAQRDPATGATR